MEAFYSGLRLACDKWGVDIVGGDTTSSYTGLAISITCIGEARKEDIVYRNGAKDTDLVCVSGDLGAAYMGLQLLEREKIVYYGQISDLQKKIAEAKAAGDDARLSALNSQFSQLSRISSPTSAVRSICCSASFRLKPVATSLRNCVRQASVRRQ